MKTLASLLSITILTIISLAPARASAATCGAIPPTLVVLDRSGSMSSSNKWTIAQNAINGMVSSFNGQLAFGLMTFPGPGGSCAAGTVNAATSANSAAAIKAALQQIQPTGLTPIGASLNAARAYLMGQGSSKTKYVILVTDGSETCSGDPVSEASALLAAGVRTYVVGFVTGANATKLQAIATAGGTQTVYHANQTSQLQGVLQKIGTSISCCGNGTLDKGEQCDTQISSGTGACPKSCDDNNKCTKDVLVGSGCSAKCTHTASCTNLCGNGRVDAGERCDTKISGGKGACPTAAYCKDKDPCTIDKVEGTGCLARCAHIPAQASLKKSDNCCPKGLSSQSDIDCKPLCGPDDKGSDCVDLCSTVKCAADKTCQFGKCVAKGTKAKNPSKSNPNRRQGNGFVAGGGCACDTSGDLGTGFGWFALALGLLVLCRRRRIRC